MNIPVTFGPPTTMAAVQQDFVFRMKAPLFEPRESILNPQKPTQDSPLVSAGR